MKIKSKYQDSSHSRVGLFRLIPDDFRRKGLTVAFLVPFAALLNMFGVALLFSMVFMVLDGGVTFEHSFLADVMRLMGIGDRDVFTVVIMLLLLLFILIKSAVTIFISLYQNRYLMSLYRYFSSRLFTELFDRGLLFVKNSNTSDLTFNVNAACYNYAVVYLGNMLRFWGDVLFFAFVMVALSLYDIRALVSIVVAFIPVTAIHVLFVRKRLKQYGKAEFMARRQQTKLVQETFKGYAEMKVNDAFGFLREKFDSGLEAVSDYRVKSGLIQALPSRLYELAIAVIMVIMVLFHLDAGDASERIFLGVFAVVIVRMLPVVMSLVGTWSAVKNSEYTVGVLEDLRNMTDHGEACSLKNEVKPLDFKDSIRVDNVSFSFPDREVLRNLSFEVKKGEKFGIRGKTGVGKSTVFNILLGLIPPDNGKIFIDGNELTDDILGSWQSIVGYVSQDVFISDATIAENVALGCTLEEIDRERLDDALEKARLKDFVNSLPEAADTAIGEAGNRISGGQKQRIGIARALYKGARVLFFDEATSSLDIETEKAINREINELAGSDRQLTILIISHRPVSLEICDRILDIESSDSVLSS